MGLTVKKLIEELKDLDCRLVAGTDGIDHEILAVDSMEIPDITPWLAPGELLVTTGYALKERKYGLLDLVRNIHATKAAGIILKTRIIGNISEEVVKEANRLGVPIIEMPNSLKFCDLKKRIYSLILYDCTGNNSYGEKVQNEFMRIMLSKGDFQQICSKIHELIGKPTVLIDGSDIILAKSPMREGAVQFNMQELVSNQDYNDFIYSREPYRVIEMKEKAWCVFKVFVNKLIAGYAAVCYEGEKNMDNVHTVMHHALNAIALEYTKIQAIRKNKEIFNDNLFVDIIMGNITSTNILNYRAESLNWPNPPFSVVLFDIDDFKSYIKNKNELEIQHLKNRISQIISNCATYRSILNAVITLGNYFVILVNKCDRESIEDCVEKIEEIVSEKMDITMTSGCVLGLKEYSDIKKAYKQLEEIVEICRKKFEGKNILFADDVLLERGFMANMNEEFMQHIDSTIGVLEEYDLAHGTDLLNVLKSFLKNLGIRKKTAEDLYIHRNTLTDKLEKIESILGIELNKSDIFFKLYLAMFIKELL